MEYDDLVDTVQKFRTEYALHFLHHGILHPLIIRFRVILSAESEFLRLNDGLRAGVTCHNDNRVFEIHHTSRGIGNPSVI